MLLEKCVEYAARVRCSILVDDVQGIIAHMASSSEGFFDGQEYHLDLVRLGTAMYGSEWNTTAARWLTRITGIKQVWCQYQRQSQSTC